MIKKLLTLFLILIVLAGIALYFFGAPLLNRTVHKVVVDYGSQITGTPVQLGAVNISPFGGRGNISAFALGNPEGYNSENAITVAEADLSLMPTSLFGDAIMIRHIIVQSPTIVLEQKGGTTNLQEIQRNILEATATEEVEEETPAEVKKLAIEELVIEDASVRVLAFGQDRSVTIPRIHLSELGTAEGGLPPAEIAVQVLNIILQHVGEQARELGMNFLRDPEGNLNALREQLDQIRSQNEGGGLEGAARGLRNFLDDRPSSEAENETAPAN